jgi:hypothetical protein
MHPEFSTNCLLLGDDEPAIRALLSDELLAFLAAQDRLRVEGTGDQLVVYRRGRRIRPDEAEPFEQVGLQILALLRGQ